MASITIRRLDDALKAKLRVRAASHGRSMEAEARQILEQELNSKQAPERNLADAIRSYFEPLGGVELKLPRRLPGRRPPVFDE
jgi:plasmid stability protein